MTIYTANFPGHELIDGENEEAAVRRYLTKYRRAWFEVADEYDSEGENVFGDHQIMCALSTELGSMDGVTLNYWASEEWPGIDSDIACSYRRKDCEKLDIAAVVRGASV